MKSDYFSLYFPSNYNEGFLLVVQNKVRGPNFVRGNVELGNVAVIIRIPPKVVIRPFLGQNLKNWTLKQSKMFHEKKLTWHHNEREKDTIYRNIKNIHQKNWKKTEARP